MERNAYLDQPFYSLLGVWYGSHLITWWNDQITFLGTKRTVYLSKTSELKLQSPSLPKQNKYKTNKMEWTINYTQDSQKVKETLSWWYELIAVWATYKMHKDYTQDSQ